MAVYLDIYNLVVSKKAIAEKYTGGIEKFRLDYGFPASEVNQEDAYLFSFGEMDADEVGIEGLVSNGLNYNADKKCSDDFVIVCRYGDPFWEVDWLKNNNIFAWHIDADSREVQRVNEICSMSMDSILDLIDKGKNPLKAVWIKEENH